MSRLAALKEFTFMQKLWENGFPVPEPISQNRHTIVMSLVDGVPLRQVKEVGDSRRLYADLMELIIRLARYGLVHGDFNEFNIMIIEKEKVSEVDEQTSESQEPQPESNPSLSPERRTEAIPILIDFPQTISIDHPNADMYFDRDVACIKSFFKRKFHFTSDEPGPYFQDARREVAKGGAKRLDVEAEASGFSKKMARDLERYMEGIGATGDGKGEQDGSDLNADEDEDDSDRSEDGSSDDGSRDRDDGGTDEAIVERDADEAAFRVKLVKRKQAALTDVEKLSLDDHT